MYTKCLHIIRPSRNIVGMKQEWRRVPGYEDYEVTDNGLFIRKGERCIRQHVDTMGYMRASVCRGERKKPDHWGNYAGVKRSMGIHRLVAAAFIGPCPDGLEVNHKDGDKKNNRVENLEYMTHRDNIIHARDVLGKRLGFPKGAKHPFFGKKMSEEHKRKMSAAKMGAKHFRGVKFPPERIVELREAGKTHHEIAVELGVGRTVIGSFFRGEHWSLRDKPELMRKMVDMNCGKQRALFRSGRRRAKRVQNN